MHESTFDALTRRASLAGLGAALLATVPAAALAGKGGSKARKKARKKCRRQVAPCAVRFKDECCAFLGSCNAAAASECLIQNFII